MFWVYMPIVDRGDVYGIASRHTGSVMEVGVETGCVRRRISNWNLVLFFELKSFLLGGKLSRGHFCDRGLTADFLSRSAPC